MTNVTAGRYSHLSPLCLAISGHPVFTGGQGECFHQHFSDEQKGSGALRLLKPKGSIALSRPHTGLCRALELSGGSLGLAAWSLCLSWSAAVLL